MANLNRLRDPLRHHREHEKLQGTFGNDRFGELAEKLARFFGTPKYITVQTLLIIVWMIYNGYVALHVLHGRPFDPYPWILLNLLFSTQAAYAAPLILLAQTRAAARDKALGEADAKHREDIAAYQGQQLDQNTKLTQSIHDLQVQQMTILSLLNKVGEGHGGPNGNPYLDSSPGNG